VLNPARHTCARGEAKKKRSKEKKLMMKYSISVLIVFFITINIAEGQRITLIAKDELIYRYQEHLVKYLIEKQQLENVHPIFNMKYYKNKMYVIKCLEFCDDPSEKLILVKFGNLDDHGWICWALLGLKNINLFTNTRGEEFKKLFEENRVVVTSTIKAYVDIMDQ